VFCRARGVIGSEKGRLKSLFTNPFMRVSSFTHPHNPFTLARG